MTMTVTDEQVAALRAYLGVTTDAEDEETQELIQRLSRPGAGGSVPELVYAAFVIAARRKFFPAWTRSDVIRFVAQIRALLSEQPDLLDPTAAEHQLRSALGETLTSYPDAEAGARAQVILLDAVDQCEELDDAGITELLNQARTMADQLISHQASRCDAS
jgi:hypothetical protein